MIIITYRFLHFRTVLGEGKTNIGGNFFPVSIVVFNARWQVESISLQDILENTVSIMSYDEET